ncbi:MAG TPA: hypothetical protein PKV94_07700 [Syntrophales bacterium]|nr:hypothetical protein [Syntrophales bacterium]HPN24873.1 hypothetical protein [Syntrophales bacterium]
MHTDKKTDFKTSCRRPFATAATLLFGIIVLADTKEQEQELLEKIRRRTPRSWWRSSWRRRRS